MPHFSYGFFFFFFFHQKWWTKNSIENTSRLSFTVSYDWCISQDSADKFSSAQSTTQMICLQKKWNEKSHSEWKPKKEENKTSKQAQKAFYAVFEPTNELLSLRDVIVA